MQLILDSKQLPATWKVKTLDELCEIARGGSPRPIKQFITSDSNGVNWIKISDASASSKYIHETKEKIKPEGIKHSRLVNGGDFILSNSMSFGRPYIMKTSGCIHDGWLVLKDKSNLFDQDYLYYFLGSSTTYKQFDSLAAGSTVRNLNIDLVKGVKVILPPLSEQKRIVLIVDEAFEGIDRAIANTEKNLANTRELFENYSTTIFTHKGDGWNDMRLGDVCEKVEYGSSAKSLSQGDVPVIRMGNIQNRSIDWSDLVYTTDLEEINKYLLKNNDVLFNRTNSDAHVGKSAIYKSEHPAIFAGYLIRIHRKEELIDADFLNFYLNSFPAREYGKSVMSRSVNQANINGTKLKEYPISLPSVAIQQQIVEKLSFLLTETQRLEAIYKQKLAALKELKQSILHKAFTGELTADNANQTIKTNEEATV